MSQRVFTRSCIFAHQPSVSSCESPRPTLSTSKLHILRRPSFECLRELREDTRAIFLRAGSIYWAERGMEEGSYPHPFRGGKVYYKVMNKKYVAAAVIIVAIFLVAQVPVTTEYGSASLWQRLISLFTGGGGSSVPAAPSNLTASSTPLRGIDLTWRDNSGNEDGFKIERSTSTFGGFSQIGTNPANDNTYLDPHSNLINNTTFHYRVRAYNSKGNSGYSNTASTTYWY